MKNPLNIFLRPKTIEDIVGQSHLLNDKGIIFRMLKYKFLTSLIFYGPSGVGKTSLALALANDLNIDYQVFNASINKKGDLEKIILKVKETKKFILIIEEIHRMNRDRQDILLELLESRQLIIFACTTENPYFVINPAIRSRMQILKLYPIKEVEMFQGLKKIFTSSKYNLSLNISDDTLKFICQLTSGDLRIAINILELVINLYPNELITTELIQQIGIESNILGSHYGDEYHNLKSALQKSIRGSDVDASLHYLVRLLVSGNYSALMRRLLVIAYEDIGLANPAMPLRVKTAIDSFLQLGMPEGMLALGLIVVEMALSEKSNSAYLAVKKAYDDVINGKSYPIPSYLCDSSYKSAKKLRNGVDYKYPHNYPFHYCYQQYLPTKLKNVKYYESQLHNTYEKRIYEIYNNFIKNALNAEKK